MNNLIKAADDLARLLEGSREGELWLEWCEKGTGEFEDYIKGDEGIDEEVNALTAYRTARNEQGEVKVKPLVWECASINGYKRGRYAARSAIGSGWAAYIKRVENGWEYGGKVYLSVLDGIDVALDAAKIQAQSDYETRIRSALEE